MNNADGYSRAALYLANGYAGVTDAEKSKAYYEKAAGLGSCFALVELGFLYENGDVVEQNYGKAFELFQKAAEEEYPYAMYRVGLYLDRGIIGEPQPVEAFAWYEKAAGRGDGDAIFALGMGLVRKRIRIRLSNGLLKGWITTNRVALPS